MHSVLLAWIGQADLNACQGKSNLGLGPIARAVQDREFDLVVLLCNYPESHGQEYHAWLSQRYETSVEVIHCPLENPTDFRGIYSEAEAAVANQPPDAFLSFHISPGTPAMATVWILLAQTKYRERSQLLQSSPERGLEDVDLPFDVYAELGPELLRRSDDELVRLTQGLPEKVAEFDDITYRCKAMEREVAMARRLALRDVTVLIQGESGTGKELVARAIHSASQRARKDIVTVNCGALPSELVDSEFFGHRKGAFTGANVDHEGFFEAVDGGTLFLDEIGELSAVAQVRLLRTLQEGKIRRVGETQEREVNVRVIAATHCDLLEMVTAGTFRGDLFYRLAVGLIRLPPLREREGDLSALVDHLLERINEEAKNQPGYTSKRISPAARSLLLRQPWPGNVRELKNVLVRSSIWATGDTITQDDLQRSLFSRKTSQLGILDRPLGKGFSLDALCNEVQCVYIQRALDQAGNNRTKAAEELLGFPSRQTMDGRIKKIGLKTV